MADWTADELDRVGGADELQVSSRRPDGTLRPYVTIWTVRVGNELFIRSAYGAENGWYRRALASGVGAIRAAGVEREVTFAPHDSLGGDIDAEYHRKYDHYGARIVGTVVGEQVHPLTLRLVPAA